jgi:hypothetical protein
MIICLLDYQYLFHSMLHGFVLRTTYVPLKPHYQIAIRLMTKFPLLISQTFETYLGTTVIFRMMHVKNDPFHSLRLCEFWHHQWVQIFEPNSNLETILCMHGNQHNTTPLTF